MANSKDGLGRKPIMRKRFMGREDELQKQCATYLNHQYPWVLWCHIANERKAKPQYMAKLKKMGVLSGMPDIMIFHKGFYKLPFGYVGLAIELKAKYNKPSPNQLDILEKLNDADWSTHVVNNFDDFKDIVDEYLGKG
jgi:hypothetical protein